jgi:RNA polymerase sigma-70 factor (ECF subfamily)
MMLALNKLTENHRRILLLRYYDDLSYNEIASVLQVKLGTVMSRLSRARTRLAQVLGPSHPMVLEFVA